MTSACKYIVFLSLFIFITAVAADAFTAIMPDRKPLTRSQRKALERAKKNQNNSNSSQDEQQYQPENPNSSSGSNSGWSAPNSQGAAPVAKPAATPTATPTPTPTPTPTKKGMTKKQTDTIMLLFMLLLIGGVVFWYFTRNINFNKLKN